MSSAAPRTWIRSSRRTNGFGPSGVWYWVSPTGVSTNRSWVSAPVVVKVQAMWLLRPITRNGTPGAVAPASTPAGVSIRARYQMLGKPKPRCGSPASSGAPVAV